MRHVVWALALGMLACNGDKPNKDNTGDSDSQDTSSQDSADTGPVDADEDGFTADVDCDDDNADVHPDADEVCADGIDNNCDGAIDEATAVDASSWYPDSDGDGYGVPSETLTACEAPTGYAADSTDCDDANPDIHPGADESDCADPVDYNCDGSVAYEDADTDGWAACEDCNDADAALNPAATEVCDDNVDNDCDGLADDADDDVDPTTQSTWYADTDGDSFGDAGNATLACAVPSSYVTDDTDCDDTTADAQPGGTEIPYDGLDNDCDATTLEDDLDQDTYLLADDCNDADATVNPGATEVPYDGVDNDCDASTLEDDLDQDGANLADDCDDADAAVNFLTDELCNTGVDEDCDGTVDEDDAVDATVFYLDGDSDGFGDANNTVTACNQPSGAVSDATDCDDANGSVNPGADELCSTAGVDDDCDGSIDEDDAADVPTWYDDTDSDGFGDPATAVQSCSAPSGLISDGSDCDDSEFTVNPDANEICDGQDNDCDTLSDEFTAIDVSTWYADADGDGFGDPNTPQVSCNAPTGYVSDSTDCDDQANPSTTTTTDADCDGTVTADDCDDNDSGSTTLADDPDCDGNIGISTTWVVPFQNNGVDSITVAGAIQEVVIPSGVVHPASAFNQGTGYDCWTGSPGCLSNGDKTLTVGTEAQFGTYVLYHLP